MSQDPQDVQAQALLDINEQLIQLNTLLRSYLRFALGTAAKAMRAAGDLPPELEAIVKDLESWQ